MDRISEDALFKALADAKRRSILEKLIRDGEQKVAILTAGMPVFLSPQFRSISAFSSVRAWWPSVERNVRRFTAPRRRGGALEGLDRASRRLLARALRTAG